MRQFWKRVSSGKYVDLGNLKQDDISIKDIEVSLNNVIRFTGHYADVPPLTVAQHSMLCLTMAEMFEPDDTELHMAVFSHDFAEAYIGDVASPIKKAMGNHWYNFSEPIERVVEEALLPFDITPEMHDRVKIYDLASLDIERRVMWSSQYGKDKWPASPLNVGSMKDKQDLFDSVADVEWVDLAKIWSGLSEDYMLDMRIK